MASINKVMLKGGGAVRLDNVRDHALQLYLSINAKANQTGRLTKGKHSLNS